MGCGRMFTCGLQRPSSEDDGEEVATLVFATLVVRVPRWRACRNRRRALAKLRTPGAGEGQSRERGLRTLMRTRSSSPSTEWAELVSDWPADFTLVLVWKEVLPAQRRTAGSSTSPTVARMLGGVTRIMGSPAYWTANMPTVVVMPRHRLSGVYLHVPRTRCATTGCPAQSESRACHPGPHQRQTGPSPLRTLRAHPVSPLPRLRGMAGPRSR